MNNPALNRLDRIENDLAELRSLVEKNNLLNAQVKKLRSSVILLISFVVEQMGLENEFMTAFHDGQGQPMSPALAQSLAYANETADPVDAGAADEGASALTPAPLTSEDVQRVLEKIMRDQEEEEDSTSVPSFSAVKESSALSAALVRLCMRTQDVLLLDYDTRGTVQLYEELSSAFESALAGLTLAMVTGQLSRADDANVRYMQTRQERDDVSSGSLADLVDFEEAYAVDRD